MPNETVLIRLVAPTLPVGFCPITEQERATLYFQLAQAQLLVNGTVSFYNFGPTVPDPNNRLWPWIRNAGDGQDDTYYFLNGYWLSIYKSAPAGPNGVRWDYEDTEASLLTFDGGENAPVDASHGPFWEIDHNYDGRIAMGPGVITGANPPKTLGVSENYGAAAQLLSADQVGPHTHALTSETSINNADGSVKVVNTGSGGRGLLIGGSGPPTTDLAVQTNPYTTTQEPTPIIPPVRGAFKIKRTGRIYRRLGP